MNNACRVIDSAAIASVRWRVTGWEEKVFQSAPGEPWRAAGCCERCGQSIRYVVSLESSIGERIKVGQDCAVTLEGGPELAEIRRAERAYEHEQWLRSPERAAKLSLEAAQQAIRDARALVAEEHCVMALTGLRAIVNSANCSAREKQNAAGRVDAIVRGLGWAGEWDADDAKLFGVSFAKASLPPSSHAGSPGQKIEVRALFEALIPFNTIYGQSYVQKFRSESGAVLIWFSAGGKLTESDLGSWVELRGTVKAHDVRDEVPQTILTRCTVKKGV
jgi:hypothetical protein